MLQTGGRNPRQSILAAVGCVLQLLKRVKLEKTKYYKMEEKLTFLITLYFNLIKITKVG